MNVTASLLKVFPLLKVLPDSVLDQLAVAATAQKFTRRGIVINAGEKGDSLCFLFEGRLQGIDFTIDGREVGLYFIEPGDFCGELTLFDDGPQPEYVIALTNAVVVSIPRARMREIMLQAPEVFSAIGARLAARVRQLTYQRSLLGLPSISQRVCCQVWSLLPDAEREGSGSSEILNPPTHMEIAIMLNLSRESVTRVFQSLQNKQVVKRDGPARLLILDKKLLSDLAEGKEILSGLSK